MTYRAGTKGRLVLRVDHEGKVAAMNDAARHVLGGYSLGKTCDEVVGGREADGGTHCRPGCARELAAGALSENGVCRVILGEPAGSARRLECVRVGSEVHVLIERPPSIDSTERLTSREKRVLALVGRGLSSAQIATELEISEATVRTHVEHARGRLGASTRAQAVLRAYQTGQLDEDSADIE